MNGKHVSVVLRHHDIEPNPICFELDVDCISKALGSGLYIARSNFLKAPFEEGNIDYISHKSPAFIPSFLHKPISHTSRQNVFDISITTQLSCLPYVYSASDIYPVKERARYQHCFSVLARPPPSVCRS